MNEDEKYLFDLSGYILVPQVLDPDTIARCNEAIDHHADKIRERTGDLSLSGESASARVPVRSLVNHCWICSR